MLIFVPNPHVRLDRAWAVPYVPLELLSAMATARARGAEVALFDVNRLVEHGRLEVGPDIWARAAALLAETDPAAVLLETWTGTLHNTLLLVQQLHRSLPRVPRVLLGAGTSAMAGQVLHRFHAVDAVIRGEPEPAVSLLADGLAHPGGSLGALDATPAHGLVRRTGDQTKVDLAVVEDLDGLPRAAYDLALLEPGDTIPVEPGRGCAQGCTFCALAGHWAPRHRPRSPRSLADEMLALGRAYPGSSLDLTQDPVFFNRSELRRALCERLEGAGVRWTCHARVDRLRPADLEAMARAGCRGLLMGVESGCPAVQRATGKEVELSALEPTVRAAADLGLEVRASFIVGFPGEDAQALGRTARAVVRAMEAGAADAPVQPLRAYPGSPVHRELVHTLEPEPLLQTAADDDGPARALIAAHPDLLSASYRVPAALPRKLQMAAWVALSALGDVLAALWRHGVDPGALLARLAVPPGEGSLRLAVELLGRQVLAQAPDLASPRHPVDTRALADLVAYHVGLFAVAQEHVSHAPGADQDALERLTTAPAEVTPAPAAPWRLLAVRSGVDDLTRGVLAPAAPGEEQRLLLAKVPTPGEASFYTRQSFSLEVFELDELSALVLELCRGQQDLQTLAHTVAARLRMAPATALEECAEVAHDLVQAGVLALVDR